MVKRKKQTNKKQTNTATTHESCTFGARDWLIFSTNQVKVRPYMALARASRAQTACSKLSGLIICEENISISTLNWKQKTKSTQLSIYKWPPLLWLWVSCEWVPPQGQSHQQPAAGKQQHICSWLRLLPGFGAYLNTQKYKQDCSDLRKIVDLRLGGDISFSLLSFSKLSVSKMEDAAHDVEQVLGGGKQQMI